MRFLLLFIVLFVTCLSSQGQMTQAQIREQLRALVKKQSTVLKNTENELKQSKDTVANLSKELETAQDQVNKVGQERDGWKDYGNDQHEKFMNAELRVAKKQATILKLSITIGLLITAIGIYAFLKFYMRVPFL